MHWISLPTNALSSSQNLIFTLILSRSRLPCRRIVPSMPLLSKSRSKITSPTPSCSISDVASRKDLPPVFTVKITPLTPKTRRAWASFLPSTIIGLSFADSSANLVMIIWIFSSFSLSRVDKFLPCYLRLPHRLQAVVSFFVVGEVSSNGLQYVRKLHCHSVFEVHRMQLPFCESGFKFLEILEVDISPEFCWALNCEDGFSR